jgi:hypothetical protein
MAPEEGRYFDALRRKGVWVATTYPSGLSDRLGASKQRRVAVASSDASQKDSASTPLIVAKHLTPTKARILMMLALTRTQAGRELQRIFDTY